MTNEELAKNIYYSGKNELIEDLYNKNYGILYRYAKGFYNGHFKRLTKCGVEMDDMMNEGYFALLYAVKAYCESDTDYRFTAFLKYPLLNRFKMLAGLKTKAETNEPLNNALSLDAPISEEDSDTALADTIYDKSSNFEDELLYKIISDEVFKTVKSILSDCPELYNVIYMRFALNMPISKIAERLKITQSDVRSAEQRAFRILRGSKSKDIKEYFDALIGTSYRLGGFTRFKETHTSSVEWAVMKMDGKY